MLAPFWYLRDFRRGVVEVRRAHAAAAVAPPPQLAAGQIAAFRTVCFGYAEAPLRAGGFVSPARSAFGTRAPAAGRQRQTDCAGLSAFGGKKNLLSMKQAAVDGNCLSGDVAALL